MSTYTVGFIGTGPDPDTPVWGESAAMAYRHAAGYDRLESCEIVACADLVSENARAFADEFDIAEEHVYEDYEEMLAEATPDVVSVSTPVPTHAPIVLDCVRSGVPDAIHCEKPMATTWGDARLMAQEADRRDVQLTFNHQRRMASPGRDVNDLLEAGAIGELRRIELACGELLDNGTHYIDLANMYNGQRSIEWVIGQVDYREEHVKYGAHNENQGFALWEYDNGVFGMAATGVGSEVVPARLRLVGTDGEIQVWPRDGDAPLRVRSAGDAEWRTIEPDEDLTAIDLAIEHLIACLDRGEEPELSARRALDATEVIFGAYESSRRRGRVEFPLEVEDNPLEAMVESGELTPQPADEES